MDTKKFLRKCPVCLGSEGEILHHQVFATPENFLLPKDYDVVCCKNCGFVFADTKASQQEYTNYYQNFSKYESSATTTKWKPEKIKDLLLHLPDKNMSILDIGCANGELLLLLKSLGYKNVNGLDPSEKCVENVKAKGINIFKGELFSIDSVILNQKFDCIILSHVFEHICDLQKAAENIAGKLNENGILYIEVPDASRYLEYYLVPFHYFDAEHINHFDENSLNNLFSQKGILPVGFVKKESQVAAKLYPAVGTFYQKRAKESLLKVAPNFKVKDAVLAYIQKSKVCDNWPRIDELAKSQEKIAVWGAGSYAMRLFQNTSLGKCNIAFFVDIDEKRQGMKIGEATIFEPQKIKEHNGPIVVCAALYSDEILKSIKDMGINNEVIIMK